MLSCMEKYLDEQSYEELQVYLIQKKAIISELLSGDKGFELLFFWKINTLVKEEVPVESPPPDELEDDENGEERALRQSSGPRFTQVTKMVPCFFLDVDSIGQYGNPLDICVFYFRRKKEGPIPVDPKEAAESLRDPTCKSYFNFNYLDKNAIKEMNKILETMMARLSSKNSYGAEAFYSFKETLESYIDKQAEEEGEGNNLENAEQMVASSSNNDDVILLVPRIWFLYAVPFFARDDLPEETVELIQKTMSRWSGQIGM